jgi:hypothetical protein
MPVGGIGLEDILLFTRLKNFRQIGGRVALQAISVEHFPPFHQVAIAAVFLDQLVDVIAALAVALGALDAEHVELAFDVAEDEMGPRHLRDR